MSRLSTRMRRWGVVLRIASRDARQTLGRTVTAVILISLPIIIAIGSLTFWDVTTSQRYQASSWLGHGTDSQAVTLRRSTTALDQNVTADLFFKTSSDEEVDVTMETLTQWVPPGDQLIAVDTLYQLHMTAPDGTGYTVDAGTQTASLDAPRVDAGSMHGGLAAEHAVISDDVARALGVSVGDTLSLSLTVGRDRTSQTLTGTALVDAIIKGSGRAIVGDGTLDVDRLAVAGRTQTAWFVTGPVPVSWDKIRELNASGFSVVSRHVLASPPDASAMPPQIAQYQVAEPTRNTNPWQYLLLVAGVLLILTEMILLISPLYTVAQRSVMRTAAMIVANGGDRSDGRRLTIAHGLIIGAYSAGFSLALSGAAMVGIGVWSGLGIGIVPLWPAGLSVLLPILLSLMASVSPAHTSSHIDTSAVIGGRVWEPSRLVRRRMIYPISLLAGIPVLVLAAVAGSILALVLGVALLEIGLIGSIPYVFTRWRVPNGRASMSMRLALRDAVRNGHRTFPAMASILTTVFVACSLLITLSSSNEAGWNSRPHLGQRGQIFVSTVDKTETNTRSRALMQAASDTIKNDRTITSEAVLTGMAWNSGPGGPRTMVEAVSPHDNSTSPEASDMLPMAELDVAYIVDDGTYLRQAGYLKEADMVRAVATLNAGGVLVPEKQYIDGAGQVRLRSLDTSAIAEARATGVSESELPDAHVMATQIFPASPLTRINVMVLSPSAATSLGLESVTLGRLLTPEKPVSTVDAPAFQATIARQVPGASAQVIGPTMRSQVLPYIAALIAVVAAAATVALVVALSASDMRPDLDTLDAIGAAPTMRRHVTTWQGVVLALNAIPTAVLSGLIVGVLAVITFARSNIFPTLTTTLQPVVPWGALLGMLIGMPLLCALVAIVLTPRNQKRIRRIN